MNAYEAIMKAADSIERHPGLFDFQSIRNPDFGCGTPGCALGWIAHHADIGVERNGICGPGRYWGHDKENLFRLIGVSSNLDFYGRMDELHGRHGWMRSAPKCAATLRLYAEKYHLNRKLPVKYEGIPAETLAIFERATA